MDDFTGLSRRGFVQGAVISGASLFVKPALAAADPVVAAVRTPATAARPAGLSFTTDSAALHPDTVVSTACQFCNSNCRLNVGIRAGRVISVSGDPDDPVQAGNFCVKASMMPELRGRVPGRSGTRYVDWKLDDPTGRPAEEIRPVRDEIERRVQDLLSELAGASATVD